MRDRLYGDWQREYDDETILNDARFDTEGGDDVIYTGVSEADSTVRLNITGVF